MAFADNYELPTGRGGKHDVDVPQGRPFVAAAPLPDPEPWEVATVNEEQARNNPWLIPPAQRPQVVLRFADAEHLLVSGLLDGGGRSAGSPSELQSLMRSSYAVFSLEKKTPPIC